MLSRRIHDEKMEAQGRATQEVKNAAETLAERHNEIVRFLRLIHQSGDVFEVRALDCGNYSQVHAGFFDDFDKAASEILRADKFLSPRGIYLVLNPVFPELLSRSVNKLSKSKRGETSSDKHVVKRRWLYIDCDPERANGVTGIPANDAEKSLGVHRAEKVKDWLRERGWPDPVEGDSGNGAQLLYRVDLPNDEDSESLVKRCLIALGQRFTDDKVKIDGSVFNAARISRLLGTWNRKGDSTDDRPHRLTKLLHAPEPVDLVETSFLESLASEAVEEQKTNRKKSKASPKAAKAKPAENAPAATFDVEAMLTAANWQFEKNGRTDDGRDRWKVTCPFNPDHGFDAAIFQTAEGEEAGKLGFHCFHDSCKDFGWQDAKAKITGIEPPDEEDRWTSIETDEGRTDAAFARRFLLTYGEQVRWVPQWGSWLVWTGTHWRQDAGSCAVTRMAQATSDAVWHEAFDFRTEDAIDFAQDMSKPSRWNSALKAAAAQVAVAVDDLNPNRWLLNCVNGVVDLRTGELSPHRREDLITACCPTPYDPHAPSYAWDRFIEGIFPDDTVAQYVQRLIGYATAGRAGKAEEILPVLWGGGSNGKSVLIESIRRTLGGDFAIPGTHGQLTERANERHLTELASLYGKRLVFVAETGQGQALDEDLVKSLTGGESISARFCHRDLFTFDPSFTLFLITNHRPRIKGTDAGIWRRVNLIPFTQRFWLEWRGESGPPELKADPALRDKLDAERSGILAWIVMGCRNWLARGLDAPAAVRVATAEYKSHEDVIGRFVAECCVRGDVHRFRVKFGDLYAALENWCNDAGEHRPSRKRVGSWLQSEGFVESQSGGRWYCGIGLIQEPSFA